ncbi:transcriptional repressor LexA [Schlesneria paludicola]|uniref:transcriptional repressor LexA n=1 Tax=Schlesneria paludicola TaxID=360056 RepID=UPI00029A70B7|nr:transcriptional repressor LexA [Schlesneria paludicola]
MTKPTLTSRQQEIYDFLREKIVTRGYGPTVREIGTQFEIKSPNGVMCHLKALEKKGMISRESHMSRAIQLSNPPHPLTELPFAGQLTIGEVFPAGNPEDRLDFSGLFSSTDHCCLRIRGTGLQEDHIVEGDTLVLHRQPTFRDGDLAVVVYEDGSTGVKRLYQESHRIRLESARKTDAPQFVNRIVVIGIVVGVIRQY